MSDAKDLFDLAKIEMFFTGEENADSLTVKQVNNSLLKIDSMFSTDNSDASLKADLIQFFEDLAKNTNVYGQIYIYSFLARFAKEPSYIQKIYELCLEDETLDVFTLNFIRWQCSSIAFNNYQLASGNSSFLSRLLYRNIFDAFYLHFEDECTFIQKSERDKKLVVVMTSQFLTLNHAPTKTALDRCYSLIKAMDYNVLLINTREMLTSVGAVSFYNAGLPGVIEDYNTKTEIEYLDILIPFYQSSQQLPNTAEMSGILKYIKEIKPYFIVNIGGNSIVSDLCSKIVPVITLATVFSALPTTESQFSVLGRGITDSELEFLKEFGFSEKNVIPSIFSSSFKPQEHTFTRKELGLPEDKFLIAIIGGRLDSEVADDFIEMLLSTVACNTHFVFIGKFTRYDDYKLKNKVFAEHSSNLGFQSDVLAVLEVCDLYANPKRRGGGMSCVEAMHKGLPVVTIGFGDVSLNAPKYFHSDSYEEMADTIKKYTRDKDFYNEMSAKAKERAIVLTDTHSHFKDVIDKALDSELFL